VASISMGWLAMTYDEPIESDAPTIGSPPAPLSSESAAPPVTAAESTAVDNGGDVAESLERSEAGARSTAVGYLEMTEDAVSMAPAEAGEVQRSIATADFADAFAADAEQRMIELRESIPGGIVLRVAPIEVRSIDDGDEWLISIWYAQAITIVGETVVDDWRTADYRLRWEDGSWRIAAFSSDRGPMPGRGSQPPSLDAIDFEAQLTDFSDEGLG